MASSLIRFIYAYSKLLSPLDDSISAERGVKVDQKNNYLSTKWLCVLKFVFFSSCTASTDWCFCDELSVNQFIFTLRVCFCDVPSVLDPEEVLNIQPKCRRLVATVILTDSLAASTMIRSKKAPYSAMAIARSQKRISGPLLDRIDIHVEVPRVNYEKIESGHTAVAFVGTGLSPGVEADKDDCGPGGQ